MSKMKMINLPLLALFALCYSLGHPALAVFRPQAVDKTLASFHDDVNRTIVGSTLNIATLFAPTPATAESLPAPQPVTLAIPASRPDPVRHYSQNSRRLVELSRQNSSGFTVLTAR